MIHRAIRDKSFFKLKMMKEVGYILLLITFFAGMIVGSFSLKGVDTASFGEYTEYLNDTISKVNAKEIAMNSQNSFFNGIKIIAIFWIVGMSIVGIPVLLGYVGYKGYSLGYTISAIIRLLGIKAGNAFVFHYLFFKNSIIVFIMIFLANFSIKISKNFFEKRTNLKPDALKYSIVTCFMLILWIAIHFVEKLLFVNF